MFLDSLEISLFEEIDACYTYDHDSPIKHHPKHNQTKKKQKVEIKWDMVVDDDLCYEVYDGPVLLDDINYNTTENYYERGKYVTMITIIMKVLRLLLFYFYMLVALCLNNYYYKKEFSLFMLKVLFYLPMLITMFFMDLFDYKIPNRKWVRLKCV